MARYRTVRGNIFLWVSLLLVSVLFGFSLVVYDYTSVVAKERFSDALTSLSRSVMANLDAQVSEMNRLSLTLIYSQVFRTLYAQHLALPRSPASVRQRIAKLENTEALIEIGDTILGPNQSAPQVNIFDFQGEMIGAGYYSRLIDRDVRAEPWYADVLEKKGDRLILAPHRDLLQVESSVVVKGKLYMSLVRSFQDPLLSIRGIVEVKQYCDSLFSELNQLKGAPATLFVVDGTGRLLYPYEGTTPGNPDPRVLAAAMNQGPIGTGTLPGRRDPQIFATATSRMTGWTLILGEPSAGLSANIFQYAMRIALLTLVAILCSLAASYFIARRVTVPIKALHGEIESLELHNLHETAHGIPGSDLSEIDALTLAFREMRLKLKDSVQEAVALRAHERDAQMVALQAQLNPHFLHNILQTIAIMADEGNIAAVQGLITNLSRVLRYVSSTEGTRATLGSELECVESYLAAMRARFGDSLEYTIDVPPAMLSIIVPRLIIQPFIENCFKYATVSRPPWRIELRGEQSDRGWTIELLDNGPGFPTDQLERLGAKLAAGDQKNGLAAMSISGMGIFNSSERMRLAFGDRAVFELSNRPDRGARAVLGVRDHG